MATATEHIPQLTLDIVSELRSRQQTHGLRSGDYNRYRGYCQRKIRRIHKAQKFLHGSGKKYVTKPVLPDKVENNELLLLVLLQAERAWAYAEHPKEANSGGDLRVTHHRLSRLNRAVKWARDLHGLTVARCDEVTQLQAEGYLHEMVGLSQLARLNYEPALSAYTKARDVWDKLMSTPFRELIVPRVVELEQNRRLCGYKLGLDTTEFDTLEGIGGTAENKCTAGLTWRGKPLSLYSDKLRDLVTSAQEKTEAIAAERAKPQDFTSGTTALNNTLEMYDKLFICYNDAITLVKQDLRQESADNSQLHMCLNYFSYILLEQTIQRNLYLIEAYTARYAAGTREKTVKMLKVICPSDIVRLYDILVQNVVDVLALPGIEDHEELGGKYEALMSLYRAARMYWKAEAFSRANQYIEATACLMEGEKFISDTYSLSRKAGLDTTECEELSTKLRARKCIAQGSSYLMHHKRGEQLAGEAAKMTLEGDKSEQKVVECINDYVDCEALIGIPLDLQSIPCKPLFYDVAEHFVQEVDFYERSGKKRKVGGAQEPVTKGEKIVKQPTEQEDSPAQPAKGWLSGLWGS